MTREKARPAALQIPTFVITTRFLTLCCRRRIRAMKMAALLEGHRRNGQMSIFMNYVAIKGSGLRRCKLRSTMNIISRSWVCVCERR